MVSQQVVGGGEMIKEGPGQRRISEPLNALWMSEQEIEVLSEASNEKQGDVLTKDELVEPPLANLGRKPLDMRQGFPQRCRRLHMGESPGRLLGEACEVLDCPVGLVSLRVMIRDRKSTRLNSSHGYISYAVFCLKKKKKTNKTGSSSTNRDDRHDCADRPATKPS